MTLVVVGSVAFDSVRGPHGAVERMLGGSATYFSIAASYFTEVRMVGVVGEDFADEHHGVLVKRGVCTQGLERVAGKTFFWAGEYSENMNERQTLELQLNVFAEFAPKLPAHYRQSPYLFLGNIDPELQHSVTGQMESPVLIGGDTMDHWIEGKRPQLERMLRQIHVLMINDSEARQLSGEYNLLKAGRAIQSMGPETVIIKRGDNGATMLQGDDIFSVPALMLEEVFDPTGAGDSFAGGFMGYLASRGVANGGADKTAFRRAVIYGSVMGSFAVEKFGVDRLLHLNREEIDARLREFQKLTHFE
jgi:sugar/nucleoside kinase (ribokinase family)